MVNVPDYVENEDAYISATYRKIAANAKKTKEKRTRERQQAEPEFAALIAFIHRKADGGNSFFIKMRDAIDEYGALTPGQEEACRKSFAADTERRKVARERDAGSMHVGTVKARVELAVTVTGYAPLEGFYGVQHLHFLKDEAGNVIVYKGSKQLADKGAQIRIKATVKEHAERDGVKQTNISRPVIISE